MTEQTTTTNIQSEIILAKDSLEITKNSKGFGWVLKVTEKEDRTLEEIYNLAIKYNTKLQKELQESMLTGDLQ